MEIVFKKVVKIIPANYGSIPHLSTSKLTQQADKKIGEGQEEILTHKARDWRDLIIVTEKIDGTNVGVIRKGALYTISRAGYLCESSKYSQHHLFDKWVFANMDRFTWLPEGWRICGEWMLQAHGTMYDITNYEPFAAFDIFNEKNERMPYLFLFAQCFKVGIGIVPLLHIGQPISIKNALKLVVNPYGLSDKSEGVVYRCERNGKVDFLAKWVRADKEDGKYLEDGKEVWNKGSEIYML